MAQASLSDGELLRARDLTIEGMAAGYVPVGGHIGVGKQSVISYVAERLDILPQAAKMRVHRALARFPIEGVSVGEAQPAPTKWTEFTVVELPSGETPITELIAAKMAKFHRETVAREARSLIPVQVNIEGAYGIMHTGDPHVDDDGCDWATLQRHIDICNRTEGLFAANVGDLSNNWVGRLARLHANQSTTASDAVRLVEWLINAVPWLYLVGGNHDAWSGANDPIKWMSRQAGVSYEMHGMRLSLVQPNGKSVRVNARHDFKGHSMWNGTHALTKAAKFAWDKDDIYVCGHRHSAGYANLIMQNGAHVAHAISLGAYKVFDDYADAHGFSPENMPAAVTIINSDARTPAGRVSFFWDVEEGAEYLRYLRRPRIRVRAA